MSYSLLLQLIVSQVNGPSQYAPDSALTNPVLAATLRFNMRQWFENLPLFWQAIISGLATAILVLLLGWVFRVPKRLRRFRERRRRSRKDRVLVSYQDFYGDELTERHGFSFIEERAEAVVREGKSDITKSKPLETVLNWIEHGSHMLVVCGSGGLGSLAC